jgi:hypothetical protein
MRVHLLLVHAGYTSLYKPVDQWIRCLNHPQRRGKPATGNLARGQLPPCTTCLVALQSAPHPAVAGFRSAYTHPPEPKGGGVGLLKQTPTCVIVPPPQRGAHRRGPWPPRCRRVFGRRGAPRLSHRSTCRRRHHRCRQGHRLAESVVRCMITAPLAAVRCLTCVVAVCCCRSRMRVGLCSLCCGLVESRTSTWTTWARS